MIKVIIDGVSFIAQVGSGCLLSLINDPQNKSLLSFMLSELLSKAECKRKNYSTYDLNVV